jgi:hypothetical protein
MDADVSSYRFVLLSKVCVRRVCRFVDLRVMLVTSGRVSCFSGMLYRDDEQGRRTMLLGNHMVLDTTEE